MDYIIVDNFFDNVDQVRNMAFSYKFNKSSNETGWKGYRAPINDDNLKKLVYDKLVSVDQSFENLNFNLHFHYSLNSTKTELEDFWRQRFHRDFCDWAGVIYLCPNPNPESGTILFDSNNKNPITIVNVYNRLVMYNGNRLHGVEDTFGNEINNSRMTITLFGQTKNKVYKSLM